MKLICSRNFKRVTQMFVNQNSLHLNLNCRTQSRPFIISQAVKNKAVT